MMGPLVEFPVFSTMEESYFVWGVAFPQTFHEGLEVPFNQGTFRIQVRLVKRQGDEAVLFV